MPSIGIFLFLTCSDAKNTQLSLLLVILNGYAKYALKNWLNKRHLSLETGWFEYLIELKWLEKLNPLTFCNQNHTVTKIISSHLK